MPQDHQGAHKWCQKPGQLEAQLANNTENSVYSCHKEFWVLLYFTFSAQSNRKDGEDNNVLLMTQRLSQGSQPSLLLICTAWLWLCALHQHQGGTAKHRLPLRVWCFTVSQTNVQLQTSKHKALETLESKLPSFALLHVLNPIFDLISNCYCSNSLEDLLKLADSGFLAFIRMPNLPPTTSSEGSWVTTLMHLEKMLPRQKPVP